MSFRQSYLLLTLPQFRSESLQLIHLFVAPDDAQFHLPDPLSSPAWAKICSLKDAPIPKVDAGDALISEFLGNLVVIVQSILGPVKHFLPERHLP